MPEERRVILVADTKPQRDPARAAWNVVALDCEHLARNGLGQDVIGTAVCRKRDLYCKPCKI